MKRWIYIAVGILTCANLFAQDSLVLAELPVLHFPVALDVIASDGEYAYIAPDSYYDRGIYIFNVSDPAEPVFADMIHVDYGILGLATNGDILYVCGWTELSIYDVTDPHHAILISQLSVEGCRSFAVFGSLAIIGHWPAAMSIVDVSDPASPALMSNLILDDIIPRGFAFYDNVLWVTAGSLQTYDLRDPTTPVMIWEGPSSQRNSTIAQADSIGFVMRESRAALYAYNLRYAVDPVPLDTVLATNIVSFDCTDSLLAVATSEQQLQLFDTSIPENITLRGTADAPRLPTFVTFRGNEVLATFLYDGLKIFDSPETGQLRELGSYTKVGWLQDVRISLPYTYCLANLGGGLFTIDCHNFENAQIVSSAGQWVMGYKFDIRNGIALIADYCSGLKLVEVTEPESTRVVSQYEMNTCPIEVAITPNFAFVGNAYDSTVFAFDVSNPETPQLVAYDYFSGDGSYRLAARDSCVYVKLESGDIDVICMINDTLSVVDSILHESLSYVGDMKIHDQYLYISKSQIVPHRSFLSCYDVSNERSPEFVSEIDAPFGCNYMAVSDTYLVCLEAYEFASDYVVSVFDVRFPPAMRLVLTDTLAGRQIRSVDIDGTTIAVVSNQEVRFFELSPMTLTPDHSTTPLPNDVGLSAFPNPFNSSTNIRFELPHTAFADLSIYDVQGRLVRNVLHRQQDSGSSSLRVDLTDLSSGVYFARLKVGSHSRTMKLMLLK